MKPEEKGGDILGTASHSGCLDSRVPGRSDEKRWRGAEGQLKSSDSMLRAEEDTSSGLFSGPGSPASVILVMLMLPPPAPFLGAFAPITLAVGYSHPISLLPKNTQGLIT